MARPLPPRFFEVSSSGVDENLQAVLGDPYRGLSQVGLRVPFAATSNVAAVPFDNRYLFLLSSIKIGPRRKLRLRGIRQLVTIGQDFIANPDSPVPYIIEQDVTTPFWRFQDADISWHLRFIGRNEIPPKPGGNRLDVQNFAFRMADTPALLYETATFPAGHVKAGGKPDFYVFMSTYVAPNKGRPWGEPLTGDLGTFYDRRTKWIDEYSSMDVPVSGNGYVAFFASVRQTSLSRKKLASGSVSGKYLPPEEAFLQTFTNAIYWRVGGSMIFEECTNT